MKLGQPVAAELDLGEIKRFQLQIIRDLRDIGRSYIDIAKLFEVSGASSIRNYETSQGDPRADNSVLRHIHNTILFADDKIAGILPEGVAENYRNSFSRKNKTKISDRVVEYEKKQDNTFSPKDMEAISTIFHDIYNVRNDIAVAEMAALEGTYHIYRLSTQPDIVVKSWMRIDCSIGVFTFVGFRHDHPERFYNRDFHPHTRRTHGVVIKVGSTLNFLGNTRNGQAANFFTVKMPADPKSDLMIGFNTTTSSDGSVISARVIFVRTTDPDHKGVGRFKRDDPQHLTEREIYFISMLSKNQSAGCDSSRFIAP
jgi:hypothetical protein